MRKGALAGVRAEWLLLWFTDNVKDTRTTQQVVDTVIKPKTNAKKCRYVDLMDAGDVGKADIFISHTWKAPFRDLIAAVRHVCTKPTDFVWIDIFAVMQHEVLTESEKIEEFAFDKIVTSSKGLLLVAKHNDDIQRMSRTDACNQRVPPSAFFSCAFFRVWCIVEIVAAVDAKVPVVMLIGEASDDGTFAVNQGMTDNLNFLVHKAVEQGKASVEADRIRIINYVKNRPGGIQAANLNFKGAVVGAMWGMQSAEVIRSAMGDQGPLQGLIKSRGSPVRCVDGRSIPALHYAVHAAACGGLLTPLKTLLQAQVDPNCRAQYDMTPLIDAAQGGQLEACKMLLDMRANVNAKTQHGIDAIAEATAHGHTDVVALLRSRKGVCSQTCQVM